MISNQAITSAQRRYDHAEPNEQASQYPDTFFGLMDALQGHMDSSKHAKECAEDQFIEEMRDTSGDNTLMLKAMDEQTSDEELGKYVRLLMKIVARDRA